MKTKILLILLIALSSYVYSQTWNGWYLQTSHLTSPYGGAISAINKDTVRVITDGEITTTFDGGSHWLR